MVDSLHGMTALITGGAKRIGRETALSLANEGAHVVVHYSHSQDDAVTLAGELQDKGVKAWTIQADFSIKEAYESLIDRTLDITGSLDILINNASIFPKNTLADVTFDDVMQDIEVNTWAPFVLIRSFTKRVERGKIVNLIDTRVHGYDWNHVAYILSKHALRILTRMAALQYAPNFTVNAVAPGLILPPPGQPESFIEKMIDTVPLKRHGGPQDVADAIVFLLKSDFLTGDMIYIDGGRHLWDYASGPHPG